MHITISAEMSACGISAAIAAACRAKKEELILAGVVSPDEKHPLNKRAFSVCNRVSSDGAPEARFE